MNALPDVATSDRAPLMPLGPVGTMFESARQALYLLWKRRTLLWFLLIAIGVCVVAVVLTQRAPSRLSGARLFHVLAWWMLGTVIVPWSTIYLGVQAVHGELEDRTSQYLFLRPVSRVWLLLGKWAAISLAAVAFVSVCVLGAYAAFHLNPERWSSDDDWSLPSAYLQAFDLGVLAYAAVAMLFATTFRRPLAWAAFFVVGVQMVAGNLPVSAGLRGVTITDPMRRLLVDRLEPGRETMRLLWPYERDLGDAPLGMPELNLLVLTLVCIGYAGWRYCRSEYESRSRD